MTTRQSRERCPTSSEGLSTGALLAADLLLDESAASPGERLACMVGATTEKERARGGAASTTQV